MKDVVMDMSLKLDLAWTDAVFGHVGFDWEAKRWGVDKYFFLFLNSWHFSVPWKLHSLAEAKFLLLHSLQKFLPSLLISVTCNCIWVIIFSFPFSLCFPIKYQILIKVAPFCILNFPKFLLCCLLQFWTENFSTSSSDVFFFFSVVPVLFFSQK